MYQLVTASTDLTGLKQGASRVASWHFSNTGVAATIRLRDGGASGSIVAVINLGVGSTTPVSAALSYSYPFLRFPAGLYVEVVSGTVVGSVDLV
jgi:hypothetical protein